MQTAEIVMLTYGPDLSFSCAEWDTDQNIDIGRKLTYYSPYILPFSFSSPFYGGEVWDGLSVRTYFRTGPRPACMVFIDEPDKMIDSVPSLTQEARVPAEAGRIEFKAFDSCCDFSLYAALLALLKGLALDDTLPGRATVPDTALHQHVARVGFKDGASGSRQGGCWQQPGQHYTMTRMPNYWPCWIRCWSGGKRRRIGWCAQQCSRYPVKWHKLFRSTLIPSNSLPSFRESIMQITTNKLSSREELKTVKYRLSICLHKFHLNNTNWM